MMRLLTRNWPNGKKSHACAKFPQLKLYPTKKLSVRALFSGFSAVDSIHRNGNRHMKAAAQTTTFSTTRRTDRATGRRGLAGRRMACSRRAAARRESVLIVHQPSLEHEHQPGGDEDHESQQDGDRRSAA